MPSGTATNRTAITLPVELSNEIIQKTQEESAIMRLAQQINLPGRGVTIPVITEDPVANWVAETGAKPVSNPSLNQKTMTAHKLAVIVPFSNEFRRDLAGLYDALVERLPAALAAKFDAEVYFGGSGLANFDTFASVTTQSVSSAVSSPAYAALVAADTDIAEHGGVVNGYVFSPQGRGVLLGALDGQGRPLFLNNAADEAIPRLLGASVVFNRHAYKAGSAAAGSDPAVPDIIGFAGDWTQARYGTVEGVQVDYSSDASLVVGTGDDAVTINLFQQNMFAVRAEIEVGFVADTSCFNAITRTHSA